jgi:hypothetical protein
VFRKVVIVCSRGCQTTIPLGAHCWCVGPEETSPQLSNKSTGSTASTRNSTMTGLCDEWMRTFLRMIGFFFYFITQFD